MLASILNKVFGKNTSIPPEKRPPLILEPNKGIPDYIPDPIDPCFCGSEKFFKSCCGSRESKRPPPYGVFIVENYLEAAEAKALREIADQCQGERLMVIHTSSTADNMKLVEDERRVTEQVDLGDHQNRINQLVRTAFTELVDQYIGEPLAWYERPQILRYNPGGFYVRHADSENQDPDTRTWTKTIDRDFSLLIYLNDDFKGGELCFTKFNYQIRPKAGMAVLFPSDNRYMHEAQTITKGERYAIVSWGAIKGTSKLSETPPQGTIPI